MASDVSEPAFDIRRAPTVSPIRAARLGATIPIWEKNADKRVYIHQTFDGQDISN